MTVARDAINNDTFSTVNPFNHTGPTPVGTPRSVTVLLAHGTEATDLITGVTYGGVAMTRIPTNGFAADTLGEPGAVYAYHLGAAIPAGVQTVSVSHTGSATVKWVWVSLDTAAADTEIVVSERLEGNQANPQLAVNTGATSSLRKCVLYSGVAASADVAVLAGMEALAGHFVDFGVFVGSAGEQTTASTGSFTIGYTIATDDVAFIAFAIQEVAGGTLFQRSFAGSVTPVGTLVRKTKTTKTGSITAAGTLTKRTRKTLTGSITAVGILTTVFSAAAAAFRRLEGALGLNRQEGSHISGRQEGKME